MLRCLEHLIEEDTGQAPCAQEDMHAVIYAAERDPSLRVRRTATAVLGAFLVGIALD